MAHVAGSIESDAFRKQIPLITWVSWLSFPLSPGWLEERAGSSRTLVPSRPWLGSMGLAAISRMETTSSKGFPDRHLHGIP